MNLKRKIEAEKNAAGYEDVKSVNPEEIGKQIYINAHAEEKK